MAVPEVTPRVDDAGPARRRGPEDVPWSTAFGGPTLGPEVLAAATHGPQVCIGGNFSYDMAGTEAGTYTRAALWDGDGWLPMGVGLDMAVNAVAFVGTDIYVGGDFTSAGGVAASHLARWDGTAWTAVAGGVRNPDAAFGTTVRALASDGTTLWVGGSFTFAGDQPVRSLAALDLATGTWSDAGGGVGLTYSTEPGAVHALALDGPSLYVGGAFDLAGSTPAGSFARLDTGTGTWTSFGAGLTDDGLGGTASAIAVDPGGGAVVVGGRFGTADQTRAWNLARLRDDRLEAMGDVSNLGGAYAQVHALAFAGGHLYVGGEFTAIGGLQASYWARHDGVAWSVPGDGVDGVVRAMAAADDGSVVVVGAFATSGPVRLLHGGIWTGTGWRSFGQGLTSDQESNGTVNAILADGGAAYVGGLFDQAGPVPVHSIARWTGEGWDPMGGGVTASISHGQVFAMARLGGELYVAGRFANAGDVAAGNIARWDGQRWWPLGGGLDDAAYALAVLGGRLYVGGAFGLADDVPVGHLACWDPAAGTWSAVGNAPTYDDDIRALAVIGERGLVVGGDFHRFFHGGRVVAEGLWGMAFFDTGLELDDDPLAGYRYIAGASRYGGTGLINALQVVGGDLYVGGSFDVAGMRTLGPEPLPGFPAANLAVWHFGGDGSWEPVGGGADDAVHALAEVDGALAVGGRFTTAGGMPAVGVAIRDLAAGTWRPLGSGLGGGAGGLRHALALAQSREVGLWVGGEFPVAGGLPSANIACWTATRGVG